MRHFGLSKQFVAVAAVAVALAFATSGQQGQQTFAVGVTNSTTTPAQGPEHPQGHLQTECGLGIWRLVPASGSIQRFACYPSGRDGDAFDVTYKARLTDDADGNEVYHSGAVTIDCSNSDQQVSAPATSATFTLTGSGTGITASSVVCNYPTASSFRDGCPWWDPDGRFSDC